MSATCASLSQFFQPLIDQGLTGEGTHIIQYLSDPNDPAFADDPFVQFFRETVTAHGLDPKQTTYFTGYVFAWYTVEILNLANQLEGGLNRSNILIANRSLDSQFPGLLPPLRGRLEGLKDAYLSEGGRIAQYKVTDPKALGSFEPVSEVFNNEGKLGTYATVASV